MSFFNHAANNDLISSQFFNNAEQSFVVSPPNLVIETQKNEPKLSLQEEIELKMHSAKILQEKIQNIISAKVENIDSHGSFIYESRKSSFKPVKPWDENVDQQLCELAEQFNFHWEKIGQVLKRSADSCSLRYTEIKNS